MRKIISMVICVAFIGFLGCTHKVDVGTEKPIAVDVKMRVDVYHHVQKQANYIEDLVNGKEPIPDKTEEKNDNNSKLFKINLAYAQSSDKLTGKMLNAIKSRKQRHQDLTKWQSKGVLMEDNNGYVKINASGLKSYTENTQDKIKSLIDKENSDRKIIYREIANQNNITVFEAGRQFSYTHQKNAPSGAWIQVKDSDTGNWVWKQK